MIPFTKLQALGNDFVLIDSLKQAHSITPELARRILDRRLGIGGDQLLWLKRATGSSAPCDARMEILNSDGSTAEMCGNGIRAAALYLYQAKPKPKYSIDTLAGLKHIEILNSTGTRSRVDMGAPVPPPPQGETLSVLGAEYRFFAVDMGNPHAVIFVDRDIGETSAARIGAAIELYPRFPSRINVEFVCVQDRTHLQVRVWERGAGLTQACGTGACASAIAALATGCAQGRVEVQLPGGSLMIEWKPEGSVFMEGPAALVFRGEFPEHSN